MSTNFVPPEIGGRCAFAPKEIVNRIIRLLQWLRQYAIVDVGPGLEAKPMMFGRAVCLGTEIGGHQTDPDSDVDTLACNHGTDDNDDWSYTDDGGESGVGVAFYVVTDLKMDTTTSHQFTGRLRLATHDKWGHLIVVSSEGDPVVVFTTEACS